jgi:hypothetical protein
MVLVLLPRLALALTFAQTDPAPDPAPAPVAAPVPPDPAARLRECDAILADRKTETARACFEALRLQFPGTPEAHDAERAVALMAMMVGQAALSPAAAAPPGRPDPKKPGFYVVEPYSQRTNERLRLTTWEKLDFGTTAFLYGLSTGLSFAGATDARNPLPAMVVGSLAYTGLAVLYVNTATIDRSDLPLVLAITSYLPTTAGLIALASETNSGKAAGSLVAGAAVLSLPLAYWAAASTDLDPGDTQLVRDAGFWGAVWGVTGALSVDHVTERNIGISGLVGLYGGMGLGLLAARYSDVSLERVRVTTWGGYGGAIIGGLTAGASDNDEESLFAGIAIGSALGALVTFVSTGSIDEPPAEAQFQAPKASLRYLEPALLPLVDRQGRTQPKLGLNLMRGRF